MVYKSKNYTPTVKKRKNINWRIQTPALKECRQIKYADEIDTKYNRGEIK